MKLAKVEWYGEEVCENILLETVQDVLDYQDLLVTNTSETFSRMVKDRIPVARWDHYGHDGAYGNSFNMAVQKCKIFGGRPIMEFDKITNTKCISILGQIQKGQQVVINKVGGWCPVMDSVHKVLEVTDYQPHSNRKVVINPDTQYINLENDPDLEKRTIEYLSAIDQNYSYVLRLCEYSEDELVQIFKEFMSAGGHTVYVYTTGSNVNQMWEYSRAIISSGLKNVIFEFNSGTDADILEVVQYLKDNSIIVELI